MSDQVSVEMCESEAGKKGLVRTSVARGKVRGRPHHETFNGHAEDAAGSGFEGYDCQVFACVGFQFVVLFSGVSLEGLFSNQFP